MESNSVSKSKEMLITMASINNSSQFVYTAVIMANQFCLFHLYYIYIYLLLLELLSYFVHGPSSRIFQSMDLLRKFQSVDVLLEHFSPWTFF